MNDESEVESVEESSTDAPIEVYNHATNKKFKRVYRYSKVLVCNAKLLCDDEQIVVIISVVSQTLGGGGMLYKLLSDTGGATTELLDLLLDDSKLSLKPKQIVNLLNLSASGCVETLIRYLAGAFENLLNVNDDETLDEVSGAH